MAEDRTDLHTPQPDQLLEAYRQQILAALDKANTSAAGVDDNYYLADLAFSLIDSSLSGAASLRSDLASLQSDLDALAARVAALEPPQNQ